MSADGQKMLDELDGGGLPSGCSPLGIGSTSNFTPSKPVIRKISYTHDAMIDLIIANPAISNNGLALHFGYSASWISTVRASDSFKARLAERRAEIIDPQLISSVELQFKGMLARSMEVMAEKLSADADKISDQTALRAMELSSRALGYGAANPPQVNVQVNVDTHLEKLGGNLTKLLQRRKEEVTQGTALPVPMEDEGDE